MDEARLIEKLRLIEALFGVQMATDFYLTFSGLMLIVVWFFLAEAE